MANKGGPSTASKRCGSPNLRCEAQHFTLRHSFMFGPAVRSKNGQARRRYMPTGTNGPSQTLPCKAA